MSPYNRPVTVAVVPILNLSGSREIDTLKVTDTLYSELQQVEGFAVIPVNRMLAQMERDKILTIETPQQAISLSKALGADIIIVSAITEYNPYFPPIIGMAVQLYGQPESSPTTVQKIDPVVMERLASPLKVSVDIDPRYWPKNQIQRIYNSRDKRVAEKVERFAKFRGTAESPLKWELYLHSQEYYLRFVCYEAIAELLDKEVERINMGAVTERVDVKEYN